MEPTTNLKMGVGAFLVSQEREFSCIIVNMIESEYKSKIKWKSL